MFAVKKKFERLGYCDPLPLIDDCEHGNYYLGSASQWLVHRLGGARPLRKRQLAVQIQSA